MVRAARAHGLKAQGMRLEIDALHDYACPMILFWNFNHFLVLEGLNDKKAWINDPARTEGPVRVGLSTLMDALLPGEPLAALLRPDARLFEQHRAERCED